MTEIQGKVLTLKTMSQKELRALWRKYAPAPESGEKPYIYNEETVDLAYEKMQSREGMEHYLGIYTKNGEIIGMIIVERIVNSESRCEFRILLANESYRSKGYGTEAVIMLKGFIKNSLGLTRIYADVSTKNSRMQAVMKKAGFMHTKTFKANYPDGGDRMVYFSKV